MHQKIIKLILTNSSQAEQNLKLSTHLFLPTLHILLCRNEKDKHDR